jgi:hypothetical protein
VRECGCDERGWLKEKFVFPIEREDETGLHGKPEATPYSSRGEELLFSNS